MPRVIAEATGAAVELAVSADATAESAETSADEGFDETLYRRAYPDVAGAIERGELKSAEAHYLSAGKQEARLTRTEYLDQALMVRGGGRLFQETPKTSIDRLVVSESGAIFLVGWTGDQHRQLTEIVAYAGNQRRVWQTFPRLRRADVEAVIDHPAPYHYGFWVFAEPAGQNLQHIRPNRALGRVEFGFADGSFRRIEQEVSVLTDEAMRDLAMGYFANASYHGNGVIGAFNALDTGVGSTLVHYNQMVSADIARRALVQRFGGARSRFKASIIVPLYGIHHYHAVQSALFAGGDGIEDYEFIYVLNSPELMERLTREMRIAEMIYGHAQSLVVLPYNAGFGAANNVAVRFARSDRLIFVNPDVFPKDPAWARKHADAVENLPAEQTRLFGTTLYYDDGSLMHGGMYIDLDQTIASGDDGLLHDSVLRVEHHGKGAPDWAMGFKESRPVTAVTGAFISVDRAWFDAIGQFSETYIYGHYEDADLCLKSLKQGVPSWMHDIEMWHLEGKGSIRLPHHAGGSLVNRWLFTRGWRDFVVPDLIGRAPEGLKRFRAHPKIAAKPPSVRSAHIRATGK